VQLFLHDHETLANGEKAPNFENEGYMRAQLVMDRIVDGIFAMRKFIIVAKLSISMESLSNEQL
jgi:hypothetical protein